MTLRHPLDPDQCRSTKATAVLALGIVAVIFGPLLGGVVPAVLALALARPARAELAAGGGYLTGARPLRTGVTLAWVGLGLAAAALIAAILVGVVGKVHLGGIDFPDTMD